jgi:hypothetical protein
MIEGLSRGLGQGSAYLYRKKRNEEPIKSTKIYFNSHAELNLLLEKVGIEWKKTNNKFYVKRAKKKARR